VAEAQIHAIATFYTFYDRFFSLIKANLDREHTYVKGKKKKILSFHSFSFFTDS
jgi:hypothetical protein